MTTPSIQRTLTRRAQAPGSERGHRGRRPLPDLGREPAFPMSRVMPVLLALGHSLES